MKVYKQYYSRQHEIRQLLLKHPEGMPAKEISDLTCKDIRATHVRLKTMIDTYIVGWIPEGKPIALWTVVPVPQNCPRPAKKSASIARALKPTPERKENAATL